MPCRKRSYRAGCSSWWVCFCFPPKCKQTFSSVGDDSDDSDHGQYLQEVQALLIAVYSAQHLDLVVFPSCQSLDGR